MEDQLGTSINHHFILKNLISFHQGPKSLEEGKKIFSRIYYLATDTVSLGGGLKEQI